MITRKLPLPLRRDMRTPTAWAAWMRCRSWAASFAVMTTNVSRRGVFVRTDTPPPVGEQVELEIQIPGEAPVRLSGAVCHSVEPARAAPLGRPPGAGILCERAEDLARLAELVRLYRAPTYDQHPGA